MRFDTFVCIEKMYIFIGKNKEQGLTMKIKFFLLALLMSVAFVFAQDPAEASSVAGQDQSAAVEQPVDLNVPTDQASADGNDASAKSAAAASTQEKSGDSGLTWRGWTRILSFSAAALCIGGGIFENFKAESRADDYNDAPAKIKTYAFYKSKRDDIKNAELLRNVLYGVAGGAVVIGLTTFAF